MKVNVNPDWTLEQVVREARKAYIGGGITSRGYRNSVIKVWANMVGKKRALTEIQELINHRENKKSAAQALGMSLSTFNRFLQEIRALPDPPKTRKPTIFLCHGSQDKPRVRDLYKKLIAHGYEVWFDEVNLIGGQDWDFEIQKAVRSTDIVIVCLSRESKDKTGYIQKEIRIALDAADYRPEGRGYIIPLRLEECQVPLRLTKWQWVDYYQEDGFHRLILALKANEVPIE